MIGAGLILVLTALASAPLEVPGEVGNGDVFLLSIPGGAEVPQEITFLDQSYPPLPLPGGKGAFFLVAVDLDTEPGTYPVKMTFDGQGRLARDLSLRIFRRDYPEEKLTLPEAMVTPPKEVLDRIAGERKAAAEVYRTSQREALWSPPFTRPVDGPPSGNFGRRRILNGLPRSPHSGEDFSAPAGTPVQAVARGRVMMAQDLYYSGLTLLIDHGAGLVSQYFHLQEMVAGEGDMVRKGDVVGKVGSTGRVTGPHLHFGLRLFEKRVNPLQIWELFPE
jgi:hypothetical protein